MVNKCSHMLHNMDPTGDSDPVTASLMAEDVQIVMKNFRPSQREAGHDTAIRPASGLWATRPQTSSIRVDVPLICMTLSRCAGNLDKQRAKALQG